VLFLRLFFGGRRAHEPAETTYYTWDEDSRLVAAEPPAGVTTLVYNADGLRVGKETPSESRKFIYDFRKLLQETDGADDPQRWYTFTTEEYGDLISQYDGSDTLYHQYDGLGSTDALLDEWETATDRYAHRAFGLEAARSGTTDNPFTYVGRQSYYKDPELELYLLGARYYDPQAGRFLSHDPLRYQSDDVNLYAYVHNNPVNATDPNGKWPQWLDNATATVKTGAQRAGQAVKRTATATYETARGAAVAVGQGVSYAVSATGEAIATVGNKVVEGVQLAALETFNQGLKLAGVTPDQFWQVMDNLGDVAKPLISQGKTLVGNFLGALNLGFSNFLANIGKHLLGGLTEWLLRRPITSFNLKDLAGTLLQVLELTWGHILGLVARVAKNTIGERAWGAILRVISEVAKFIELGPGKWLEEKKEQIAFRVSEFRDTVIGSARAALEKTLLPKVVSWIARLLGPVGAAFTAVKAIYDAVQWFLEHAQRFGRLVQSVFQGFRDLVSGASVGQIGNRVEETLAGLVAPVFDALAKAVNLGDLPKTIRTGLDTARNWIQEKLVAMLQFLFRPLKGLFGGAASGAVRLTPSIRWEIKRKDGTTEAHELWVETAGNDDRHVRVMVASGQPRDAKDLLEGYRTRAQAEGGPSEAMGSVAEGEGLLGQVERTGENLPQEIQGATEGNASQIAERGQKLIEHGEALREAIKKLQEKLGPIQSCPTDGRGSCDPCADAGLTQGYDGAKFNRTTVSLVDQNRRNFNFHKVLSVLAWLDTEKGTGTSEAARLFVQSIIGKPGDTVGHVIGNQFGGPGGKTSGNIFPQEADANKNIQRTRENQLAAAIRAGKRVCVEIKLIYNDPNLPHRPSVVDYEAWIDGVKQNYTTIRNP
jgi:RHS repeat-associated protein